MSASVIGLYVGAPAPMALRRLLEALAMDHELRDATTAGRKLQELGCRAAILTLGSAGCLVIDKKATHIPSLPVRAVDTTAAGDAFNGALAVALAEGLGLVDAARFATRAAAIAVIRAGAQPSLPTRAEIDLLGDGRR